MQRGNFTNSKSLSFLRTHNKVSPMSFVLSFLATSKLGAVFKEHQFCNVHSIKVLIKTFIPKLILDSAEHRILSFHFHCSPKK